MSYDTLDEVQPPSGECALARLHLILKNLGLAPNFAINGKAASPTLQTAVLLLVRYECAESSIIGVFHPWILDDC